MLQNESRSCCCCCLHCQPQQFKSPVMVVYHASFKSKCFSKSFIRISDILTQFIIKTFLKSRLTEQHVVYIFFLKYFNIFRFFFHLYLVTGILFQSYGIFHNCCNLEIINSVRQLRNLNSCLFICKKSQNILNSFFFIFKST